MGIKLYKLMKRLKLNLHLLLTFFAIISVNTLFSQDSCTYQVRLVDTGHDGWDDSQLYIRFGNNAEKQ